MAIHVSKDGHVFIGNNEWASLERIQQAVLRVQNPGLNTNCGSGCQCQRNQQLATNEEHLPLPSMAPQSPKRNKKPKQTINVVDDEQHLPLPSMQH